MSLAIGLLVWFLGSVIIWWFLFICTSAYSGKVVWFFANVALSAFRGAGSVCVGKVPPQFLHVLAVGGFAFLHDVVIDLLVLADVRLILFPTTGM